MEASRPEEHLSDCNLFILGFPSMKKADECKIFQSNEINILSISWVIDQLQRSKSFKRNPFELILIRYVEIWSIITIVLFYPAFCSGCRQWGQKYHLSISFKYSALAHFWGLKLIACIDMMVVVTIYSFQSITQSIERVFEKFNKKLIISE